MTIAQDLLNSTVNTTNNGIKYKLNTLQNIGYFERLIVSSKFSGLICKYSL